MASWLKSTFGGLKPSGPPITIRSFRPGADETLSKDGVGAEADAWAVEATEERTVRLFEVAGPALEQCMLTYRARLRSEALAGRAFLELWCRLPGKGEFFSKGIHQAVQGTTDWASCETPFLLKKGQRPDLIKLDLVVEGAGRVWIKDVELLQTPLG